MRILLTIFLFLLFNLYSVNCKVKLVIDLIRHGARAPVYDYPFFKNIKWPILEELTPVGERQECLLGRLRRHQYIENAELLNKNYDPTSIYVRSTNTRRTLMSAQAYLNCFYPSGLSKLNDVQMKHKYDLLKPPINFQINNSTIDKLENNATPNSLPIIPIQSVEYSTENLLISNDCEYTEKLERDYFESNLYKDTIRQSKTWRIIMQKYPSITMPFLLTKDNAYYLADYIICADTDGRRPSEITDEILNDLKDFYSKSQEGIFTMSLLRNKLEIAEFTKEVLKFMEERISKKGKVKYVLYSGHDVSLIVVLIGLSRINKEILSNKFLPFASNLLFELEETDGKWSVKILLNGQSIHSDNYESFKEQFKELGTLKESRETLCKIKKELRQNQEILINTDDFF